MKTSFLAHSVAIVRSNFKGLLFTACIVIFAMYLSSVQSIKDTTHLAATAFAIIIGVLLSPWFLNTNIIFKPECILVRKNF